MKAIMIRLKCITNLHVGNGDVNYNIVDNEVEKDPVTGYPMINSSGVKGALRKYLKGNDNEIAWFGQERKSADMEVNNQDKTSVQNGKLSILDAMMLAIPMRASKGAKAYYLASTEDAIEKYNALAEVYEIAARVNKVREIGGDKRDIELEGEINPKSEYDGDIYVVSSKSMNSYSLPVLARNCLDDGRSVNLWYEEYVPHESEFYFPVLSEDAGLLDAFKDAVNGKIIQLGGHASIGYGLCKVTVEV